MKKQTIANIAIELMKRDDEPHVGYPVYGFTQSIWEECFKRGVVKEIGSRGGRARMHPLSKMERVLKALEKDSRFESFLIKCCGSGNGERLMRIFKLKSRIALRVSTSTK